MRASGHSLSQKPDDSCLERSSSSKADSAARARQENKKIGKQAMKGIMVGYDDMDGTKAYRIYVPNLKKIVITPDVTFMDFKATTGKIPDVSTLTDQLYNKLEKNDKTSESKSEPNETKQVNETLYTTN